MKKEHFIISAMLTGVILFNSVSGLPQSIPTRAASGNEATTISSADQNAVKEIFRDVNPARFNLQFKRGNETMGSKPVSMQDLQQIKRNGNGAASRIFHQDVVYVIAVGKPELESVIGSEKTAKLNKIIAKYL